MATTPTQEQVVNAVVSALHTAGVGTVLHFEHRKPSEAELIREYQATSGEYDLDLWLIDCDARGAAGPAPGERYTVFDVQVRHLCVRRGEDEASRQAKFRVELARTALEGNADVFHIGGQYPLRNGTSETVDARGRFVDREGSRYYETTLTLEVEARRWV